MAYCPNCGREGNNFCPFCGAKVYIEPKTPKETSAASPNIFFIILSALCFIAGLILFAVCCKKTEGRIYLNCAGVSALIYVIVFTALTVFL
jgi:hypothetical protein